MERTSADLYERATNGDGEALQDLLEHYLPQLHAFVRLRLGPALRVRESSLDLVQSVCGELLAGGSGFEFQGEERFRAWLFTSALNKIREKHRFHNYPKRNVRREVVDGEQRALLEAASYLTPSVDAIGKETALALQSSLDALTDEHREVITMARVVKLPHAVIAEVMGRSEEAVRQLLVRALVKLSQELRARGVELQ